jgi:hypothetical protein
MGEAGQARARHSFDWRVIVAAYQELWAELAERRAKDAEVAPVAEREISPHPSRGDPYHLFAGYPANSLGPATSIALTATDAEEAAARLDGLKLSAFGDDLRLTGERRAALLTRLAEGPARLEDLIEDLPAELAERSVATVAWLAKFGILQLSNEDPEDGA